MVLYSGTTCPFSQRCRLVLFEKGMDFEIRDVDLFNKPEIIVLSKVDISENLDEKKQLLENFSKKPVFEISAAAFTGLDQVLYAILETLKNNFVS